MESIFELFDKRNIAMSLQNFGIQDIFTSWEIKSIIDNQDIFSDFYSFYPLAKIETLDDYYLYLLSLKFDGMRQIIDSLKQDEHKKLILNLADSAKKAYTAVNKKDIIGFINEHIKEIFDTKGQEKDICHITLEIIPKYITGIKLETLEFLANNYCYLLIDQFDLYEKTFENNPHLFEIVFPDNCVDYIHALRLKDTLDIWCHILNKNKSNLKEIVNDRINKVADIIVSMNLSATKENIFKVEKMTREFYIFLQKIKSKKANEIKKYAESSKKLLNDTIKQQGNNIKYSIPAGEMLTLWKKIENWQERLIRITHNIQIENNTVSIDSKLSFDRPDKHPLMDIISTNIPHDDFFTFSHQQKLSIWESVCSSLLLTIMIGIDSLNDYLNCVSSVMIFIAENTDTDKEKYRQDIEMLSELLLTISQCMKEDDIPIHGLCYGASMYICALAEKILRDFYFHLSKNEKYIPPSKATLGELLSISNPYIVSVFGENHVKHLSFFLQKIPDSEIGRNYRNALAHWIDFEIQDMKPDFVAKTLWLFTDVLNTVFVYFLDFEAE